MGEIRAHGQDRRYHHQRIGINGRMDTLQAGILLAKLEIFTDEVKQRTEIGEAYTKLLAEHCPEVIPPYIENGNSSVYAQYTIQVNNRDEIIQKFKDNGIPTAVHYPIPINQQPALYTKSFNLPISQQLTKKVMSLPMHPYLTESEQKLVVEVLK